jgi:hypothetical protein
VSNLIHGFTDVGIAIRVLEPTFRVIPRFGVFGVQSFQEFHILRSLLRRRPSQRLAQRAHARNLFAQFLRRQSSIGVGIGSFHDAARVQSLRLVVWVVVCISARVIFSTLSVRIDVLLDAHLRLGKKMPVVVVVFCRPRLPPPRRSASPSTTPRPSSSVVVGSFRAFF